MKRWVPLCIGALLLAVIATTTSTATKGHPVHAAAPLAWNGAEQDADGPQSFLDLAASSGQPVTQAEVQRAAAQADALPDASDTRWQFVGPSNIAGRVTDLAIDPTTSPSTVYASIGSGGVFKSTDAGNVWTPAWPTRSNQAVGALARGSDGTLYAGTGEGSNPSGGGSTFMGNGLHKLTDGGASWKLSGLQDSGSFARIVVSPDKPRTSKHMS